MTCQTCSTPNFRDDKYCRECGTRFPPPLTVPTEADGEEPQVVSLLEQASVALEAGDTDGALANVQGALAVQPHSAAAHSALAVIYERQGKVNEAVAELREALALQSNRPADERKLEELLSRTGKFSAWGRPAAPRMAWVAAGVTALVVVGGGLLAMARQTQPQPQGTAVQASAANLSTATTLPAAPVGPSPLPASGARPMPSVPIPQAMTRPGAPVVVPTPAAPARSIPSRQTFSQPVERVGLPPVVNRGAPVHGIPAAAIGEVVPLPASAASGAGQSPESPLQPPAGSGVVGVAPAVPVQPQAIPQPAATAPPRVEPLETETGFIRIEVGGRPVVNSAVPPGGVAPAAAGNGASGGVAPRATGIGLQFGGGSASASGLDGARGAQRSGLSALRLGRIPEAKRSLAQALRLYEAAAAQAGPGQEEARRGAETCRRALDALK